MTLGRRIRYRLLNGAREPPDNRGLPVGPNPSTSGELALADRPIISGPGDDLPRLNVPGGDAPSCRSAAGDEGDYDVRCVAVEVLSTAVIDGRGAGIGVTSGDLHIA